MIKKSWKIGVVTVLLLGFSLACITIQGLSLNDRSEKPIKIYMAAALFNGRETEFNLDLTQRLEENPNFTVFLPQRDGFEFRKLLSSIAREFLVKEDIHKAIKSIIYFLDMGYFIHNSDIIVANLDEILDEGVAVEITYARFLGKPIIGFRTDVRTPYSFDADPATGAHFFVTFQCHYLIWENMPSRSPKEAEVQMNNLSNQIVKFIQLEEPNFVKGIPSYARSNPMVQNIQKGADLLYQGITDIHSEAGIREVVKRFKENQNQFFEWMPKVSIVKEETI